MKRIDILLLYEGRERELESIALLETELKRRGYTTKIECVYPNKEWLPFRYKAKVIFTPWAYNNRDMSFLNCFYISKYAKVINFHHEQYSGIDGNNILLPEGKSKDIYHISWGPNFTNDLIKAGCDKEKICEAGNIRLDFFKKRFNQMGVAKKELAKEFNIDDSKKWILFIANGYHLANEIKLENMCTIDKFARDKARICIEIRKDFLAYAEKYLKENSDVILIYRPHPVLAELDLNTDEIQRLCKEYRGRFFCIFKYAIRDWIINCDASFSIHSTSGVESYAASKPFYLFRTRKFFPKYDYSFYAKYCNIVENYSDFTRAIKHPMQINKWDEIREYYRLNINQYSYIIICDFVDRIIKDTNSHKVRIMNMVNMFGRGLYKQLLIVGTKFKPFRTRVERKALSDHRYNTVLPSNHDIYDDAEISHIERSIQLCIKEEI